MNAQHGKAMEAMKEMQKNIKEIKNLIENICTRLSAGEDIVSDLENKIRLFSTKRQYINNKS